MKVRPLLPLLVIVTGILFTLFLLSQIPEGAYFSGDAGLKALLTAQLAEGTRRFDLIAPKVAWVQDLWQQGLYPYQPPYAYHLEDRYFITFPYTFPLVTAPFLRVWGYWGLYIVPLLGVWAVWGIFYSACRLLKFSDIFTALGLGILIFASPLTLYSAMYWEHSLAVALAFGGLVLLLWARARENSLILSILSGICLGLSVWFRPEALCLVILLIVIAFIPLLLRYFGKSIKTIPHPVGFSLSAMITTILFFCSNQLIYGHYLGIHGIQAVEKVTLAQKVTNTILGIKGMGWAFIVFMPIVCFIVCYGLALLLDRPRLKPSLPLLGLYAFSLILLVVTSALVPPGTDSLIPGGKQWGTRFLLILVPILILATLQALRLIVTYAKPWLKYLGIAFFSGLLLLSIYKNTVEATAYLQKGYQGLAPAIAFLQDQPHQVIAISHQFVGQAMEASVNGNKLWFKVENPEELTKLAQALVKQDQNQFLYLCYPFAPCPLPELPGDHLKLSDDGKSYQIHWRFLGKKGKYPAYQASIDIAK